ncbi:MAG: DMT family transporter [Lautropia sp.]
MLGIALMVLAVCLFTIQDTIAKYLSERYPPLLVVWARYFFNVAIMLVLLGPVLRRRLVTTRRPLVQLARGAVLSASSMCFFSALPWMKLADASAVTFLGPMLVTVFAVFVLKHRAPPGSWIALVVSFAGVLLVIKPGGDTFSPVALLPLLTALCFAAYQLLTSRLSGVDEPVATLFLGAFTAMLVVTLTLPWTWRAPASAFDLGLFAATGAIGAVSHYVIIRAFALAPPATLAPFTYAQIVMAVMLGWVVFGDLPDLLSFTGMGMIATTGVVMALRQRRR